MEDSTELRGKSPEATCDALEGAALDEAVARAEDLPIAGIAGGVCFIHGDPHGVVAYRPSVAWEQGGPIIERERIGIHHRLSAGWEAIAPVSEWHGHKGGLLLDVARCATGSGPTPLIAAMRAYVASKA